MSKLPNKLRRRAHRIMTAPKTAELLLEAAARIEQLERDDACLKTHDTLIKSLKRSNNGA